MSYIQYIASARPLPVGTWSSSPLREYPSYEAYGRSPDFQTVWENSVASWEAFQNEFPPEHRSPFAFHSPEEKLERNRHYRGRIEVYDRLSQRKSIRVENFKEWEFSEGRFVTLRALRKHLTLPEVYQWSGSRGALYRYLCWAMQPGERVEVFTCWNGEEKKPLGCPVREFDLQKFVDCGQTDEAYEGKGSSKTIFLAPDSPQPLPLVREKEPFLVIVSLEDGAEWWVMAEKQRQDRERKGK